MGNPVNKYTTAMTSIKVVDEDHELHGQAGYVVEPPKNDDDVVAVKMDVDGEVYEFAQSEIEELN